MFIVRWRESGLVDWRTLRVFGSEKDLNEVVSALRSTGCEVEQYTRTATK